VKAALKAVVRAWLPGLRFVGVAFVGLMLGLAGSIAATPGGLGGTGIDPGGIGGTGISPGGIGGTGIVAIGPVQRFGSIFVNGGEYELPAQTRYRVDGQPASEKSLHLGDMVRVHAVGQGGRLDALAVDISHAVIGRVSQIDRSAGRLVVLGQTVQILPGTLLRTAENQPLPLSRLKVGDEVRISALDQGAGHWQAMRLTQLSAPPAGHGSPFLLRGKIEATSIEATSAQPQRVKINGVWLPLRSGAAQTGLAVGAEVVARGSQQSQGNVIDSLQPIAPLAAPIGARVAMVGFLQAGSQGRQGWELQGFQIRGADALMKAQLQSAARPQAAPVFIVGTLTAAQTVAVERVISNVNALQFALPPLAGAQTPPAKTGDVGSMTGTASQFMSNGAGLSTPSPAFVAPTLPAVIQPGFTVPSIPAAPAVPQVPQMPAVNMPSVAPPAVAPPSVSPPQVPAVVPPTVAPPVVNTPSVTTPSLPSGLQIPTVPRP
jgi:hypothetical protein